MQEGDQVLLREAFDRMEDKPQIAFAARAEDAERLLRKEPFNLILLDLNLPGKSGKDFLKEFMDDNKFRRPPIVVLTSSSAEKDIAECYALGASGYLIKPSSFDELENVVEALGHFWCKMTFTRGK